MRRIIVLLLSVLILPALLVNPIFAQGGDAPWPTEGWQMSSPEAQGMNSQTLAEMVETMAVQNPRIHSVLVVRNGYLVLEGYRYPYMPEDLHTVYSVTKSVNSAVFGIAMDQGYIEGVEQPMLDFFPDYTPANLDAAKQAITLQNLLTMSPGFDWPGGMYEPLLGDMMVTDDWTGYTLDLPMDTEPGNLFVYNSAVSSLLAAITAQATGQPLLDFAQANLFDPLGIQSVKWATDPQGHYLGGFGLQMTPRDMARFGYLYLNDGQWDGQQVVSADWVAASTQKHINARPVADGYGYQWWVNVGGYYMANGFGGQYIIVHPAENLVVVFTSASPPNVSPQEGLLRDYILPAIEADEPLPDNPEGVAALDAAVEQLAQPIVEAVPALPETATRMSGQEYHFADNEFGWESLLLSFDEAAGTAELVINGEAPLMIGLDNVQRVNNVHENEAIFAIGFDNILRVDPVAGEEPMLMTGSWPRDDRFAIRIELQGTVNEYQLTLTFQDEGVQVTTRNELSGSSVSLTGSI